MDDVKSWIYSKTVWASIISVVAVIAGYFRFEIASADQAALVDAITSIVGAVAGIVAIYGRVNATKQIGKP